MTVRENQNSQLKQPKAKKHGSIGSFNTQNSLKNYESYGKDGYFRLTKENASVREKGDNGQTYYKPFSRYINIKSVEQCEETNEVTLTLEYLYNNKYHLEQVTRDQILVPNDLRKLSKKGVDVYSYNEKLVSAFLRAQEEKAPYQSVFTYLGWCKKEDELVYKHFNQIGSSDTKAEYRGTFDIKPKGTLEDWLNVIKDNVLKHKYLEFILAVGFSAPLVGLFSTELDGDSLLIHIYGKSSRGKTTATKLAVSPFGKPTKTADGLIKSWGSTKNAIFVHLRNNFGVPIVLDEASMSNIKDFTSMIYMFAENREKDRMTKNGDLRKQGKWATTIISTAEHSLFNKTNNNEGLRVRAFEVGNVYWTESAEHANKISEGVFNNYGHAGVKFVEYLQKLGLETVRNRCKEWAQKCEEELPKSDYLSRVSEKFGIILATAEMVNEVFNIKLNTKNIMKVMYEMEEASKLERDADDKAYQYIIQKVIQNQKYFIQDGEHLGYECWGKIDTSSLKAEVSILKNKFLELMNQAEITNFDGVLNTWKERGYLKAEKGKNTNRRIMQNSNRETVYVVLMDKSELKEFSVHDILKAKEHAENEKALERIRNNFKRNPGPINVVLPDGLEEIADIDDM